MLVSKMGLVCMLGMVADMVDVLNVCFGVKF